MGNVPGEQQLLGESRKAPFHRRAGMGRPIFDRPLLPSRQGNLVLVGRQFIDGTFGAPFRPAGRRTVSGGTHGETRGLTRGRRAAAHPEANGVYSVGAIPPQGQRDFHTRTGPPTPASHRWSGKFQGFMPQAAQLGWPGGGPPRLCQGPPVRLCEGRPPAVVGERTPPPAEKDRKRKIAASGQAGGSTQVPGPTSRREGVGPDHSFRRIRVSALSGLSRNGASAQYREGPNTARIRKFIPGCFPQKRCCSRVHGKAR